METETVLTFWLGQLDDNGLSPPEQTERWWKKDPAFDEVVRDRFGGLIERIAEGGQREWLDTPRGRLAYVIALDQFTRNAFRGSARAFTQDGLALATAEEGITLAHDRELRGQERVFLYMPFMHSEDLVTQERGVALFRSFRDETSGALRKELDSNLDFAERHRDVIARWGRFPHRNQVLGRASTEAELDFLQQPGSSF
jgi:uncharacterized protein (DUF924 family)